MNIIIALCILFIIKVSLCSSVQLSVESSLAISNFKDYVLQYPAYSDTYFGNYVLNDGDENKDIPPEGECSSHLNCGWNGYCDHFQCQRKIQPGSSCSYAEQCHQDYDKYEHAVICHPVYKVCMPLPVKTQHENCTHDIDCKSDLFCINKVCDKTVDYQCTKNSECGTTGICIENSCGYNDLCRSEYLDELLYNSYKFKGKQYLPHDYVICLEKNKKFNPSNSNPAKKGYYIEMQESDVLRKVYQKKSIESWLAIHWVWIVPVLSVIGILFSIAACIGTIYIYYQYKGHVYIQKKKETLEVPLFVDDL